jgi:transposase InsO family protein
MAALVRGSVGTIAGWETNANAAAQTAGSTVTAYLVRALGDGLHETPGGLSREGTSLTRTAPPVHLRLRGRFEHATERLALRATLNASHLFGLATGAHLRLLRSQSDPLTALQARLEEAELKARLAWDVAEILAGRLAKLPERRRPFYSPAQRFRILEIKNLMAWSAQETARVVLVCANTILNWEKSADPQARTVGACLQSVPPVRRAADVVVALAQQMTRLGCGGQDLCARVLARAGWRVSARSLGRYRKERALTLAPPSPPTRTSRPVIANFVHHVWMMDVSLVQQFLGPDLYMAAVFDAFSRAPLVLKVFDATPSASDMARLFRRAVRSFGHPKYLLTDLGGEFTGLIFLKTVARLGTRQRFASAENLYATARLERFWRTLKETAGLYRLHLPLTQADLERRLAAALVHYVCIRPHEGLRGATPAEAFLGVEPAHRNAIEAPRGRRGEGPLEAPFKIEHLDPEQQRHPVLKPIA